MQNKVVWITTWEELGCVWPQTEGKSVNTCSEPVWSPSRLVLLVQSCPQSKMWRLVDCKTSNFCVYEKPPFQGVAVCLVQFWSLVSTHFLLFFELFIRIITFIKCYYNYIWWEFRIFHLLHVHFMFKQKDWNGFKVFGGGGEKNINKLWIFLSYFLFLSYYINETETVIYFKRINERCE